MGPSKPTVWCPGHYPVNMPLSAFSPKNTWERLNLLLVHLQAWQGGWEEGTHWRLLTQFSRVAVSLLTKGLLLATFS